MTADRRGLAALLVLGFLALGALASAGARAQGLGLSLGDQDNGKPVNIEADQGIEWQQNNHVYIARGNAKAQRGQVTVYGDRLLAYYRPAAPAGGPDPGKDKDAAKTGDNKAGDGILGGAANQIYRIEAEGKVRIATETQTIYGDRAIYDVDKAMLVVTGKDLKLETPRDMVSARDSLEWYDKQQLAVARGNAVAVREGKQLHGDVLTAAVVKPPNQPSHISRIDAQGNVLVSSLDQIARGDAGVYNVDTGIATLTGRVTLTKADNELRGRYAVVDLNNNVSRLLSAPPSTKLTEGRQPRVEGILMPRPKPGAQAPR